MRAVLRSARLHAPRRCLGVVPQFVRPPPRRTPATWCAQRSLHTSSAAPSPPPASASPAAQPSPSSEVEPHRAQASPCPLVISKVDQFAQSRVKNYVQRVSATAGVAGSEPAKSVSGTMHITSHPIAKDDFRFHSVHARHGEWWCSSFELPVLVLVNGVLMQRCITALGIAKDAKLSAIAACMHAERCLDALHVPLFTSQRRQHQRVLDAQAQGRTAPEASDLPLEIAQVELPAPVLLPDGAAVATSVALPSYQPPLPSTRNASGAEGANDAAAGVSSGGAGGPAATSRARLRKKKRQRRRFENHSTRFGGDQFMRTTFEELTALHSTLLEHNRLADDGGGEDDDDDIGGGGGKLEIRADEVAILQPELSIVVKAADGGVKEGGGVPVAESPLLPRAGNFVALEPVLGTSQKVKHLDLDESEGGAFDLVDGPPEKWHFEAEVPGSSCLRDTGAVARVSQYLIRVTGHSFAASVQVHVSEEDTFHFLEEKKRHGITMKRWYTASLELRDLRVRAVGKGTTQAAAHDLCAMHAEQLLQWFGVPIYTSARAQSLYYDACLRWGRSVAPVPIDPTAVDLASAKLPKPLKELYRNSKTKVRGCERCVAEKLFLLNRMVVHAFRQHLVEADPFDTEQYLELFALGEPCVRSFMVAMRHPFECAIFNFVYQKDSQYRASVYLPLPERYGCRGGYAIGNTPRNAAQLCALSAVDVLCALDVVPEVCMQQPRWQRMLELRESMGFLVPPLYVYQRRLAKAATAEERNAVGPPPALPHPQLRSPPGYREATGLNRLFPSHLDVWRIMLMDVEVFDVLPDWGKFDRPCRELLKSSVYELPRLFFGEVTEDLFQWETGQAGRFRHFHHYTGRQHHHGRLKIAANNFWLELPLDRAVYGQRIAVGRCRSRTGAERACYAHALRILRALKLTPWDVQTTEELAHGLYKQRPWKAAERQRQWKWLCENFLDAQADEDDDGLAARRASVPEAEVTSELTSHSSSTVASSAEAATTTEASAPPIDMRHVLTPYPVMSFELAVAVFT